MIISTCWMTEGTSFNNTMDIRTTSQNIYITAAPKLLTHVHQCGLMKKRVVGGELQEKERTWISLEYRTEVSQSVL